MERNVRSRKSRQRVDRWHFGTWVPSNGTAYSAKRAERTGLENRQWSSRSLVGSNPTPAAHRAKAAWLSRRRPVSRARASIRQARSGSPSLCTGGARGGAKSEEALRDFESAAPVPDRRLLQRAGAPSRASYPPCLSAVEPRSAAATSDSPAPRTPARRARATALSRSAASTRARRPLRRRCWEDSTTSPGLPGVCALGLAPRSDRSPLCPEPR